MTKQMCNQIDNKLYMQFNREIDLQISRNIFWSVHSMLRLPINRVVWHHVKQAQLDTLLR